MGPASLQGTLLQDLDPRRTPGDPGQNLDPGLNLDLGQGGVLVDTIQDHALVPALTGGPGAGLTVGIIDDDTVTAIPLCLLVGVMLETGQILTQTVVSVCLD